MVVEDVDGLMHEPCLQGTADDRAAGDGTESSVLFRTAAAAAPPVPLLVPATPETGGTASSRKGKRGQGGGGTELKGKRKCRGCQKVLPDAEFPANSAFCWYDKRALDLLARQAKAQGPQVEARLRECRTDPVKVEGILRKFREHDVATGGTNPHGRGQKKVCGVAALSHMESFWASSAVSFVEKSEMMEKEQYLHWAQEPARGSARLGRPAAEAQWEAFLSDPALLKTEAPAGTFCEVPVAKCVDRSSTFGHGKTLDLKQKEIKKPDETVVQEGKKKLLRDHDKGLGRHGEELDFEGVLQGMVSHGASSTFTGPGPLSATLASLIQEGLSDEEATATSDQVDAGSDGAPLPGGGGAPQPGSVSGATGDSTPNSRAKRPKKMFDPVVATTSVKRTAKMALDRMETFLREAVNKVEEEVSRLAEEELEQFREEIDLARERQRFCQLLLADGEMAKDEEHLQAEIKAVTAAPCPSVSHLRCITSLRASLEELCKCPAQDPAALEELKLKCAVERHAATELGNACVLAAKEIASARLARKRMEDQEAKRKRSAAVDAGNAQAEQEAARAGVPSPKRPGPRARDVFEFAQASGLTVAAYSSAAKASTSADLSKPLVIGGGLVPELPSVLLALKSMSETWASSLERAAGKRVAQSLAADHEAARAFLLGWLPTAGDTSALLDESWLGSAGGSQTEQALRQLLLPSVFAIPKASEVVYNEPAFCAAVRYHHAGTRLCILASLSQLEAFVADAAAGSSDAAAAPPSANEAPFPQLLWRRFLNMTQADVVHFTRKCGKFQFCTQGPGDLLYVPPAWFVAEHVGNADVVGMKVSCVPRDFLSPLTRVAEKLGDKTHPALQAVLAVSAAGGGDGEAKAQAAGAAAAAAPPARDASEAAQASGSGGDGGEGRGAAAPAPLAGSGSDGGNGEGKGAASAAAAAAAAPPARDAQEAPQAPKPFAAEATTEAPPRGGGVGEGPDSAAGGGSRCSASGGSSGPQSKGGGDAPRDAAAVQAPSAPWLPGPKAKAKTAAAPRGRGRGRGKA